METIQTEAQQQTAQQIIAEQTTVDAPTTAQIPENAHADTADEPSDEIHASPRYSRYELDKIIGYITEEDGLLDPEYILLFGSLAGGTPHSEPSCYDLIVAVRDIPTCGWQDIKRGLRHRVPYKHRSITYINIYVYRIADIKTAVQPHLYFAHAEGELVYCKERYDFRRPKRPCNFATIYCDTKTYFDTFMPIADLFVKTAATGSPRSATEIRWATYTSVQAAIIYYRILHFVYHNGEFDCENPIIMHERLRTLSSELMILFDGDHAGNGDIPSKLAVFGRKALSDISFSVDRGFLTRCVYDVARMGEIVRRCCNRRLELYKSKIYK